jgi:hypothetical protein
LTTMQWDVGQNLLYFATQLNMNRLINERNDVSFLNKEKK